MRDVNHEKNNTMKNNVGRITFLLLALTFIACNKSPHEKIKGEWDIVKIENSAMTEQSDIDDFNEMNAEVIKNEAYSFQNKKITRVFVEPKSGTWKMDKEGKLLIIDWGKDDFYSPHKYDVLTLDEKTLQVVEHFDVFDVTTTFEKK